MFKLIGAVVSCGCGATCFAVIPGSDVPIVMVAECPRGHFSLSVCPLVRGGYVGWFLLLFVAVGRGWRHRCLFAVPCRWYAVKQSIVRSLCPVFLCKFFFLFNG